ncbi:hypothetical protein K402DRAFT_423360 [Aulographum hederae CBS 113979]|uniref:SMP-LTD domain-containing protein n=1 Tax=Aulographum hederae CBS 113979 TaxID=1176131 RepID=A0A6G1GSH2_9PEZI|nr:hypothetical protein K402DRAFT_423360 [Aulographum hederae CBS 113979]
MVTFTAFVCIYVLGGLTFLPLLLACVLLHAHLTLPSRDTHGDKPPSASDEHTKSQESVTLPEELKNRLHEPDVAAGYFAVCREYVPGGVNGKPPERTTPAGAVIAAESPSVYQSMYRSIFERSRTQGPQLDAGKSTRKPLRRARNVFYVVLRLGHLMLYDDAEQLEVRHVISLAHHDVDLYAGGEAMPDGELFIKRNCIRLANKRILGDLSLDAKPFYLFSDNCSMKEDFYHAMLQNQEKKPGSSSSPPTVLRYETAHIIKLVQQIYAAEESAPTRWINALIGRIFLSMYRTSDVENFIRSKITKKISRVSKPAFINSIAIRNIDMGDAGPMITNPKLRELTVDGDLTLEVDVKYQGNFKLEIAATARIDLGSRFKPRDISLVLASILKRLEGRLLIRIKPPPSNRLWISFETAPKMEMSIEPIVSARQITYGVILRAIESRIREVVNETLVQPNWDDVPFFDTTYQRFRGGIWEDDSKVVPFPATQDTVAEQESTKDDSEDIQIAEPVASRLEHILNDNRSMSTPLLSEPPMSDPQTRKSGRSASSTYESNVAVVSPTTESSPTAKPKAMRSQSFASSSPIIDMDLTNVEFFGDHAKERQMLGGLTAKGLLSRSSTQSSPETLLSSRGSRETSNSTFDRESAAASRDLQFTVDEKTSPRSKSFPSSTGEDIINVPSSAENDRTSTVLDSLRRQAQTSASTLPSLSGSTDESPSVQTPNKRDSVNASLSVATSAAKKWGLGFVTRHGPSSSSSRNSLNQTSSASLPLQSSDDRKSSEPPLQRGDTSSSSFSSIPSSSVSVPAVPSVGSPSNPIGRGRPLPPPGTPLPMPQPERNNTWVGAAAGLAQGLTKRKPVLGNNSDRNTSHRSNPGMAASNERALTAKQARQILMGQVKDQQRASDGTAVSFIQSSGNVNEPSAQDFDPPPLPERPSADKNGPMSTVRAPLSKFALDPSKPLPTQEDAAAIPPNDINEDRRDQSGTEVGIPPTTDHDLSDLDVFYLKDPKPEDASSASMVERDVEEDAKTLTSTQEQIVDGSTGLKNAL